MKFPKKTMIVTLVISLVCGMAVGCCAEETAYTCEEIVSKIASSQSFEELTPQELPEIESYLFIDDCDLTDAALWMDASAATVEVIIAVSATDKDALDRILEELKLFVVDQIDVYRDYVPEEIPKLKNAVMVTHNLQAVLVVCKDAQAAQNVLDEMWPR